MDEKPPFNPLDKANLGRAIVEALLSSQAKGLNDIPDFLGAGIYAIYYRGPFDAYGPLSARNRKEFSWPIYVGKAIPKGGRKGGEVDASLESNALSERLRKHQASIQLAPSLAIQDFAYRSLVVDDVWISLGETLVIQRFQPLWNHVVEGFGNNDPGSKRYEGKRPLWDELHPGRPWARRCKPPKHDRQQILAMVSNYMQQVLR